MSSFWENSTTQIRQKPSKTINQSLPTLASYIKAIKTKGSSQSIHQFIQSNDTKFFRDKENSIVRNLPLKKQTLTNLCSRSTYKLPSKYRQVETSIVQYGQALVKIEQVFNEQFSIGQGDSRKGKRTFNEKVGFKKLGQFQTITMESNPKKCAKRQFQQIFRLFDRKPLIYMQNTTKQQRDEVHMRPRKNNTITYTRNKQRQQSQQKRYDENLSQLEKEQFIKQTKAFQKAEKHLLLKSYTVKIFYHHLNSELAIEVGMFDEALQSLYYCEYYARKIDFDLYIVPCLIMQSEVKQSLYEFDEAIKILKTALEFSIVKKWKQMEMRILEKVSIVYYYRGNSYMAKYYKELSQIGMPLTQREIYIKEYSKSEQLRSLEARIFSLPFEGISKKKHNQKYELDISRDLFMDHQNMIVSQHEQVSSMLRSNKTSKIGIKLRRLIIENSQRAQVTKFSPNHSRNDYQILPRFIGFDYPMEHCNQILKSHLSKGRLGALGQKNKGVNFIRSFAFMKTLYRRLNYQLMSEKRGQNVSDKENMIMITVNT